MSPAVQSLIPNPESLVPSLELYPLQVLRHPGGPTELAANGRTERLHGGDFSMDDEGRERRPGESAEPVHDLRGIGVRRHRVELLHAGMDGDGFAMDLDAFSAVHKL